MKDAAGSLVAVLLLIGLLCVIGAGSLAIRFAPRWSLQADMRSRLDPNSAYFTALPDNFFLPVNPAILTPPIWINVFLTPGQSIPTRVPQATATPQNTSPPTQSTSTSVLTATPTSTGTFVFFTPTKYSTPKSTATKTATAIPNVTLISSRTPTATSTATRTATSTATRTATVTSIFTATSTFTSTATPTNTPPPEADLQITISDNATAFEAGASIQYSVVVSNPTGPAAALGAAVNSNFSANLENITWSCAAVGGASCTGGGSGNIADTVNLPPGTSVSYWVNAQVIASPIGNLKARSQSIRRWK